MSTYEKTAAISKLTLRREPVSCELLEGRELDIGVGEDQGDPAPHESQFVRRIDAELEEQ